MCGSEQVSCTATAVWSIPDQDWLLSGVSDDTFCEDCDVSQALDDVIVPKLLPQTAPFHPYVVVYVDDDEQTTWISSHEHHAVAQKRYNALKLKYPNGSFDIWCLDEAKNLPLTSFIF